MAGSFGLFYLFSREKGEIVWKWDISPKFIYLLRAIVARAAYDFQKHERDVYATRLSCIRSSDIKCGCVFVDSIKLFMQGLVLQRIINVGRRPSRLMPLWIFLAVCLYGKEKDTSFTLVRVLDHFCHRVLSILIFTQESDISTTFSVEAAHETTDTTNGTIDGMAYP